MGCDVVSVGVYNSCVHHSISCSGFLRCCESEPFGDRREIVGSPHSLNSSHTLAYNPNARRAYEKYQHAEDFGRIKIICTFNSL